MTKELLVMIIKNTIRRSNLLPQQQIRFNNIIFQISLLKEEEIVSSIELHRLLGNNFTIENNEGNIYFKEIIPKIVSFNEKTEIKIFHPKISHPVVPIAIRYENERLKGYSIHFTTTNYSYEELIKNIEINNIIPEDCLIKYKEINIKGYNKLKESDVIIKESKNKVEGIFRPPLTWFNGKFGDLSLIKVIDLPNGKSQYISPVLIEYDLENDEFKKLFLQNKNNILLLEYKQLAQDIIKNMENIEKINPFTNEFSIISSNDLKFIDLTYSSSNFNLENIEDRKLYFLTASNITYEEYLIKTGKLVPLESLELIKPLIPLRKFELFKDKIQINPKEIINTKQLLLKDNNDTTIE